MSASEKLNLHAVLRLCAQKRLLGSGISKRSLADLFLQSSRLLGMQDWVPAIICAQQLLSIMNDGLPAVHLDANQRTVVNCSIARGSRLRDSRSACSIADVRNQ
jgi:hypothetical protein